MGFEVWSLSCQCLADNPCRMTVQLPKRDLRGSCLGFRSQGAEQQSQNDMRTFEILFS